MSFQCSCFCLVLSIVRADLQSARIVRREAAFFSDRDGEIIAGSGAASKQALEAPRGAIVYLFAQGKEDEMKTSLMSVCHNLVGAYPILVVHGSLIRQDTKDRISQYHRSISSSCLEPNRSLEWVKPPSSHDPDGKFELDTSEEGYHTKGKRFATAGPDTVSGRRSTRNDVRQNLKARPSQRSGLTTRMRQRLAKSRQHRNAPRSMSLLQTGSGDYKAMIAFWLFDVFELAHQRGFEYLMRLDTDSILDSQPKEDPFSSVRDRHAVYGYRAFCFDSPGTDKIWNRLRDHVENEKIIPRFEGFRLNGTGPAPMVYTNFEVTNVSFFRRRDVQKFARSMLHETATSRLGDAVIRAFQLGLFADASQVVHLDDFRYRHGCDRWWWILNKTTDCAIEEGDPFVVDWETEPDRFGPPVGHCYSSRLDPERVKMQSVASNGKGRQNVRPLPHRYEHTRKMSRPTRQNHHTRKR